MTTTHWFADLAGWLGKLKRPSEKHFEIACADCPIVMSCGLEPRTNCLPRLEAVAAGRRRQPAPSDIGHNDPFRWSGS